jgi:phospholipase/carboxylesterase
MNYTYPHIYHFEKSSTENERRVLIHFHGTGGNERDLLPLAKQLYPGVNYLGVRGNVSEHGMPRFFRRLTEGVFDEADIRQRSLELHSFITEIGQELQLDLSTSVAMGYSNGANIITAINFLHPGIFETSVLLRPMTPLVPEVMPDLSGMKVWLSFGSNDPLMPMGETEKLSGLYAAANAALTVNIEVAGHQLVQSDLIKAHAYLNK